MEAAHAGLPQNIYAGIAIGAESMAPARRGVANSRADDAGGWLDKAPFAPPAYRKKNQILQIAQKWAQNR